MNQTEDDHLDIPRHITLDGFALEPGCSNGVALQSLSAGTVVTVNTRNTRYQVVVLNPATRQVTITGGAMFPESVNARLEGTTIGGCVLRVGWIGVGLRVELSTGAQRIITSSVRSITIDRSHTVSLS